MHIIINILLLIFFIHLKTNILLIFLFLQNAIIIIILTFIKRRIILLIYNKIFLMLLIIFFNTLWRYPFLLLILLNTNKTFFFLFKINFILIIEISKKIVGWGQFFHTICFFSHYSFVFMQCIIMRLIFLYWVIIVTIQI